MPSRWEIALTGPADAAIPLACPAEARAIPLAAPLAVVSGWLDDPIGRRRDPARPPGTGSSHADQARKWAFGPLRTEHVPASRWPGGLGEEEALTVVGVRLLDDALRSRLEAAVRPGRTVRLGAHHYRIAAPPRLVDEVSWRQLSHWSGQRAWQIRFVTPVCLRRGGRTSPWPAPESVARGLAERWHRLDPATAPPLPGPGAGPVWVSDIEGRSDVQVIGHRTRRGGQWRVEDEVVSGFTGRIRYVCDAGTDAEATAYNALMRFAVFAGVGSHTTYGFGVLVPEPTWQPPTTRAGSP